MDGQDRASESSELITGLRDPDVARRLARDGFARAGVILSHGEVNAARSVFDDAMARLGRPVGETWFPTILLPDDGVRALITERLETLISPKLAEVFDPRSLELMRLDFSVKPSSASSELGPHQDFSLVDERHSTSVYVWIPLEDTDLGNGTLHVVPGSHRFANSVRSEHVPARFDAVLDLVRAHSTELRCRAGELVVMVAGLIHHSPVNSSGRIRLAVHGILTPTGEPLFFYYADEQTPDGMVECYRFGIDDYVRHIHQGRPDSKVGVAELIERPPTEMTRERFRAGLAATADARTDV